MWVYIFPTRLECSFYIFSTRLECSFTSSPLVSSVVFLKMSYVTKKLNELILSRELCSIRNEVLEIKEKIRQILERSIYTRNDWKRCLDHTRNEWRRCLSHTRNEWRRCKTTLETSGEDVKLHSKRV